eukprot:gene8958-12103_t
MQGACTSEALAANDRRTVVGRLTDPSGERRAFRWTPEDGLVRLEDLIDDRHGWHLQEAVAINATGTLVGTGLHRGQPAGFPRRPLRLSGLFLSRGFPGTGLPRHALAHLPTRLARPSVARADEGMWLYSAPPRDQIKKKYGFDLTDAWMEHLMKSSKLSDEKNNYLKNGFYAATQADEKKCVDLELNVLQSIEDVTLRVNAAIPVGATGDAAVLARRKIIAEIEKESLAKTGLRSDVVTLYQGG